MTDVIIGFLFDLKRFANILIFFFIKMCIANYTSNDIILLLQI